MSIFSMVPVVCHVEKIKFKLRECECHMKQNNWTIIIKCSTVKKNINHFGDKWAYSLTRICLVKKFLKNEKLHYRSHYLYFKNNLKILEVTFAIEITIHRFNKLITKVEKWYTNSLYSSMHRDK